MILFNILLCVLIIKLIVWFVRYCRFRQILGKIPSPPGHWLIGNLNFVLNNPSSEQIFNFLRESAKNYWPIYRFRSPYIVTINILHPEDFEIVLSQTKHLSKSRIYGFLENWLGEGLLTSTGSKWQTRRKILTQAFHFNILRQFLQVFNEETSNLVNQIKEINRRNRKPTFINILPLISFMTLQSISETAMGIKNIEETTLQKYRNYIHDMGSLLITRVTKPWNRIGFIYKLTKEGKQEKIATTFLHNLTYRVIRERENFILKNSEDLDHRKTTFSGKRIMKMLDLLIHEKIKENSIDYKGIREEVDTFMFEGHDTSAAAIGFLLLTLAQYKEVQEKVREEILETLGTKLHPTYADLQELPYTDRVIKETLRLYPSVPFISRVASEDFTTNTGYFIPKGAILHMHIFDLHRDPRIYPNPEKFDPDRFLPENSETRHPFAYLPFSAGPRNCIGQRFALLEIKSVICGVLRNFMLEEGGDTKPAFFADLILRTKSEIRVKFIPLMQS